MGSNWKGRWRQSWAPQALTPLMEGPDPEMQEELVGSAAGKKESSWEAIREWFKAQKISPNPNPNHPNFFGTIEAKTQDLRLILGVLGCPLAPIPFNTQTTTITKDVPLESSIAQYIIQQYMAASGCLKEKEERRNMYASGGVKMICCETEISSGKSKTVKCLGSKSSDTGCFVLWQMLPDMWSLELVVAAHKVVAGSNGKIVWRHTPWLGTHAAKGPQRPLRRIIQGLDPKSTASLFTNAQCLGENRIGDVNCFVLKVSADRAAVIERSEGPAEVIRHVLYGYFCQKSGLLIYLEDSHLTRVQSSDGNDTVYWETTIGSSIGDYRDVDGILIAHQGRSIATVFRFGEMSMQHSRTRMEEIWTIDDVMFNVPGLSMDHFIPPADIFDNITSP